MSNVKPDMEELADMVEHMSPGESYSNIMKYVVIIAGGKACAIVFPNPVVHSNMLYFLNLHNGYNGVSSLLSAGFCRFFYTIDGLGVEAWGESESIRRKLKGKEGEDGPWKAHPKEDVPAIITSFVGGAWDYTYPHDYGEEETEKE